VQVPVTVCGLMVEPGDLLHGDSNGLIKVPEEGREELSRLAAKVTERESGLQRFIRGSDSTPESIYERFTH
jgi:regulator of RNase E activity RraA